MTDRPSILNHPEAWAVVPVEPVAWLSRKKTDKNLLWISVQGDKEDVNWSPAFPVYASPSPAALADIVRYVGGLEGELQRVYATNSINADLLHRGEARLAEAERVIGRLIEVYRDMEDGDGEPCPDIAAARAWRDGK